MTMIHPLSDVRSPFIGENTNVWQFCVILPKARIGKDCNICAHVLIENDVIVGDYVTIKSGVQLWDGITIEDSVFIGPNVTFTNDLVPRSKRYPDSFSKTLIRQGASIGANATILAGRIIGAYSLIGAGSVVTRDIPPHTVWYGNPATMRGYVTREGILLDMDMKDKEGNTHPINNND